MALVSYGSSGEESNDDEEDLVVSNESTTTTNSILKDRVEPEFKMRVPKSAKLPNLVPNIPIVKTKDGKVLLSVPDLEALDSSDDSDDESSRSAKNNKSYRNSKPGTDKVSLLSVLPPTRALIVREGNRPMIPHQLISKKNTSHTIKETLTMKTKPENVGQKPGFQNNNDDDDVWDADITSKQDSDKDTLEIADEDAEEVSFFSFYKPTPNNQEAVASERAAALSALQATRKKAELSSKPLTVDNDDSNSLITVKLSHDENSTTSRHTAKSWEECLPKVTISDPEILRQMSSVKKEIAEQEDEKEDVEEKVFWTEENFVPGPERKRARLVMPGTKSNNIAVNELLQSTNTEVISINQSDLTAGAQLELIKSVTSDDSQYRPKSTDDDPGKLAHRKHQITWLAHQAQENEMELEKRWAEARRNKASNRAKYGF
ncbi:unnamed protein product [Schistosoma mattheei]|uniref:Mitotic checkpoint protein prcc n=2 Tax=Schistosoma mattheei TaxID=31246 RepID=A0AA85ASA3_9TREM|nr:unnamed protein product [Schistosoma mattheei]